MNVSKRAIAATVIGLAVLTIAPMSADAGERSRYSKTWRPPATTVKPTTTPRPSVIRNLPAQPAGIVYTDDHTDLSKWERPGALVVAGRVNYNDVSFHRISAAGGTELIYIDPIIDSSFGRYHTMLLEKSECGAAVPLWPGAPRANQWGNLNDFRVGGVLQSKLECVLEKMVAENPQMGGFFADDVGSRSWFPDIDWESWSTADQQAYRDGAIAITKTFRKVSDRHGLIFLVNGTWGSGTLKSSGGGYPDANQMGNALADGGVVEHHGVDELQFFKPYACGTQWAKQSTVTKGKPVMLSINSSDAERNAYSATNCFAYTTNQDDYGVPPAPWGPFHSTGLPSKVAR